MVSFVAGYVWLTWHVPHPWAAFASSSSCLPPPRPRAFTLWVQIGERPGRERGGNGGSLGGERSNELGNGAAGQGSVPLSIFNVSRLVAGSTPSNNFEGGGGRRQLEHRLRRNRGGSGKGSVGSAQGRLSRISSARDAPRLFSGPGCVLTLAPWPHRPDLVLTRTSLIQRAARVSCAFTSTGEDRWVH